MFFEIRSVVISGLILFSALGLPNPPTEGQHALFAEQFAAFPRGGGSTTQTHTAEKRMTESGSVFTKVSGARLRRLGVDAEKFGEAWKDPSGMIWGDMVKKDDGSPRTMNHRDAEAYCKSIGAELPSGYLEHLNGERGFPNKDSDFVRLRKYMGAKSLDGYGAPEGYKAQVLPNLKSRSFWSSSVHPYISNRAYDFLGWSGYIPYDDRDYSHIFWVRCVVAGR